MRIPNLLVKGLTSVCFVGYAAVAPGFFGSLAAILPAWWLPDKIVPAAIATSLLGLWLCRPAVRVYGSGDPQRFVLDETAGQLIALIALPHDAWVFLAAFVLFRFLDVVKPWPIILLQRWNHPWAIMLDDIAAGFIANVVLRGVLWFWF